MPRYRKSPWWYLLCGRCVGFSCEPSSCQGRALMQRDGGSLAHVRVECGRIGPYARLSSVKKKRRSCWWSEISADTDPVPCGHARGHERRERITLSRTQKARAKSRGGEACLEGKRSGRGVAAHRHCQGHNVHFASSELDRLRCLPPVNERPPQHQLSITNQDSHYHRRIDRAYNAECSTARTTRGWPDRSAPQRNILRSPQRSSRRSRHRCLRGSGGSDAVREVSACAYAAIIVGSLAL